MFVSEKQTARGARLIPNELFTKAWASDVDDDGLGLELVGATTEIAREAEPVAWSLDTVLDVALMGASYRVERAEKTFWITYQYLGCWPDAESRHS